jgi:3-oxoacyl-[acyl-carrier-protein] synthase II
VGDILMRNRVAVTGIGVVSSIGCTVSLFRDNLKAGVSGIGPITLFDPAEFTSKIAGEVRYPLDNAVPVKDRKLMFAKMATDQAMPDLVLSKHKSGLSLATGLELFSMQDAAINWRNKQIPKEHTKRLTYLQTPSDLCAHWLSNRYGLDDAPQLHISACAAGLDSIGCAFHQVASGKKKWMLAGATDAMITPLGLGAFCKIRALSATGSKPFDLNRSGLVLGEGAAMLLLEPLKTAKERGATIQAEIVGYGNSFDGAEIAKPHPEGKGAIQAMKKALVDADLSPVDIGCINAHATGTQLNDRIETLAIKSLFEKHAYRIPVCATKSMLGHLIASAGAVETVAAIVSLQKRWVHPTINLDTPDPCCDLDYVPNVARELDYEYVMCNSFGFGGQNASLILRRYDAF